MAIDYKILGKRIKDARKSKGMTQEQLAAATGMSQQHIGNIETASSKLSLQALVDIANALKTTSDALLYDSLIPDADPYYQQAKDILQDCSNHEKEILLHLMVEIRDGIKSNKA